MSTVYEKMTALADEIRTLSGVENDMSLDDMAANVEDANEIVSYQTALLDYAITEIGKKAAGDGSGSGNAVLETGRTVTPTETKTTYTPSTGYDGFSNFTVNAIPSTYVGSGVTRLSERTITPSTNSIAIMPGTYLTGTQTIVGDANLLSSNIKKGVTIFNVNGTYEGSGSGSPGTGNNPFSYATEFIWTAPSESTSDRNNNITIAHSLGVKPDGFNIVAVSSDPGGTGCIVNNIVFDNSMTYFVNVDYRYCIIHGNGSDGIKFGTFIDTNSTFCASNNISFVLACDSGTLRIPAGKQYRVLVYKR